MSRVRDLNDAFRQSFTGGRLVLTPGVADLSETDQAAVLHAVAGFTAFEAGDDPYDEHDFGALDHAGERYFWKIDTYDLACQGHSPDPADPAVTVRVLTIMRADEY